MAKTISVSQVLAAFQPVNLATLYGDPVDVSEFERASIQVVASSTPGGNITVAVEGSNEDTPTRWFPVASGTVGSSFTSAPLLSSSASGYAEAGVPNKIVPLCYRWIRAVASFGGMPVPSTVSVLMQAR